MSTSGLPDKMSGPSLSETAHKSAKPRVFDIKVLNHLAEQLEKEDLENEYKLRHDLETIEGRLWIDRCEKGRILSSYHALYRPKGLWYMFCKAVRLNERTALRMIGDYTAAKAVPKSIREAASARGIDIAAKKHRPLLEELIQLGFNDITDADDLIQRGLNELVAWKTKDKKNKRTTCHLSREQRFKKAYAIIVRLYDDVDSEISLADIERLFRKLKTLYPVPATKPKKSQIPGQQSLMPESEAA